MAEDKMHGHHGGYLLVKLGILAFVYGLINYFMVALYWPAYQAWMVGGLVLAVIGVLKGKMWAGK